MSMKIEHHILFCGTEGYYKAVKKISTKKYRKQTVSGFIMLVIEPLIKLDGDDFISWALATKAGLIKFERKQFQSWEEFNILTGKIKPEEYKGIWGKFIIDI